MAGKDIQKMNTRLSKITRAVILALMLFFLIIATVFISNFADYVAEEVLVCELTRTVIFIGGSILAVPCLCVLSMALAFPSAIASDEIFTLKNANLIARISLILCVDCILFLTAIIALLCVGELLVSPLLAMIDLIGFALAFLLRILADYVKRAAKMKEEVDATL